MISICIPTFNGGKFLRACLDSALAQSWHDVEILVVDDHSTDDTYMIASAYASRDARVRVLRNEQNLGLVENWNRCLDVAKGDWIKYLFQDDLLAAPCVEQMLAAAAEGDLLVFCDREFAFEGSVDRQTREGLRATPTLGDLFPGRLRISAEMVRDGVLTESRNFFGEPTAAMFHKSLARRFGTFNADMIQLCDLEYWIRVGTNTGLRFVADPLASFRVHAASASSTNRSGRYFRSRELDRLILLHEFSYSPHLASLRRDGRRLLRPRNFRRELAVRSVAVRGLAYAAATRSAPDRGPLEEWEKIVAAYPRIQDSPWHLPLRLQGWLERNLWWRMR